MTYYFLPFLVIIVFLTVVFLHVMRKSTTVIALYVIQSAAITMILLGSFFETHSATLAMIALLTFAVKVIIAPLFFTRLIKKHHLTFSASTYLNVPLSLLAVALLTAFAHTWVFAPLAAIMPDHTPMITLSIAVMLIAFLLIVNRKGILSQMVGILSLENGIVAFSIFSGLEQAASLQAGIMFNLIIWVTIASIFASMIYRHFGALETTMMKHLKEE